MPTRILIIGILYCLFGAGAVWDIVTAAIEGHVHLNFTILMLLVGIGLLKGKKRSRSWARFWIVIGFLGIALILGFAIFDPRNISWTWDGDTIKGSRALPYAYGFCAAFFVSLIVVHKLLYSAKANAFFDRKS